MHLAAKYAICYDEPLFGFDRARKNRMTEKGSQRILSIDIYRGLVILLMCFANSTSKIKGLPWWMDHSFNNPGKENLIAWLDLIFPAFLFIMGMSIPLALEKRLERKESRLSIFTHVLFRSLILIWIGTAVEGYNYKEELTGVSTALWYFLGFVATVGLLATWPLTGSGKTWKVVLGWTIRLASIGCLVWESYKFRAGPHGGDFFTGGYIPGTPAFPASTLGYLGFAYLLVSAIWIVFQYSSAARIGAYGLMLAFFYHLEQTNPFLNDWIPTLLRYLDLSNRIGVYSTMVLAGTFIGDLFLPKNLASERSRPGLRILALTTVLLLASAFAAGNLFSDFVGVRRTLFMTGIVSLAFWGVWGLECLWGQSKSFVVVTKPLTELGKNPLFIYMGQYGFAGLLAIIINNPKVLEVIPGYIVFGHTGWWAVLTMSIPFTLGITILTLIANRLKIIVKF